MRKKLLVILGVLLALILIGAILIPRLVNPNRYKDQIVAAVKGSTGRDLKIRGDLSLSLLPLRLRLPEMELSNDPAFGSEPFARINSAAIDAKLRPLLQGNLVVNSISLNGAAINLARNKSGQNNWGSLIAPSPGEKATEAPPAGKGKMPPLEIGSLRIKDAHLSLQDDANGEKYALNHLNLETGRIATRKPVDLTMGADAEYGGKKSRID